MMTEQKKHFDPGCFGTIDKKNKESCNHCSYSDECNTFKNKPGEYFKAAAAKGKANYLKQQSVKRHINLGRLIGYSITLLILAVVGFQLARMF